MSHALTMDKPRLSVSQIVNMNVGFLGIQFSFGLQQASMSPIYQMLGAEGKDLPYLWLAGPITGLLVQPLIGAMSDRTTHRLGRRTPYFLIGALLCSLGLLLMPFSPTLWFAAGLLWILDAANNVTMEPYRAYVSDRLREEQHASGFLTQAAFTGLAQTLAYLTPSILVGLGLSKDALGANGIPVVTTLAFMVGALLSFTTVYWSTRRVPELPLPPEEVARLRALPRGFGPALAEIWQALREMPQTMRRLWWMALFQWYGMVCYWIYIVPTLAATVFGTDDPHSAGFRDAALLNGQIGGFYNVIAFVAAFAMLPFTRRLGAKWVHAFALACAAAGMWALPGIHDKVLLFVPMVGIGLAWGSIMGNPYVLLAGSIPPERAGVYMGIFNMFIVIPMLIQSLTLPLFYDSLLGGRPENVIRLAGVLLALAALCVLAVKTPKSSS
ncbi:MFS transporter [Roseateles saccharophilus]|uniref:Maltose/moltooligosaccharide transporter n=1 Tax=Roseateles saccharophilus TaxID=304 RepID=A0A4R3VEU5_ROSSA|nr:MFS transporter [Roseateles saccharophilus]MDG0835390.1 MFS transporter [Roseateles saccharophilus]TCV02252.1 maltose/moltooligosaccharide transporter [Roseateles saccharophilus]